MSERCSSTDAYNAPQMTRQLWCDTMADSRFLGAYVRRVIDDGVGLPANFELAAAGGLGLTIVRTFVELDLGGTIIMRARDDGPGTFVELVVPVGVTE